MVEPMSMRMNCFRRCAPSCRMAAHRRIPAGPVTSFKRERGWQGPTICASASPTSSVAFFKDSGLP
jgi:hypothetical protein